MIHSPIEHTPYAAYKHTIMITKVNVVKMLARANTFTSALKKKATPDDAVDVSINVNRKMKKLPASARSPTL